MSTHSSGRRALLKGAFAAGALASLGARAQSMQGLTIGIVYVGPRADFGWNASHYYAVQALKNLPGVKVVEQERVPETRQAYEVMESMIQADGAKLVLGTSYGYFNPFMIDLAKKYPQVEFRHPTTLWDKDKHPANLGGYFCYLDQAHYVDGIVAGLSTRTNKLGFVAAKPIPLVVRNVNTFLVAARKVNPAATVHLIFTGDWSLPVREAEAANTLADAGCDVIAAHVDSPRIVVETAERRGVKSCGHNVSQASVAPKGFLTGAENKYETVYKRYAELLMKGERLPNMYIGGYDLDMVQNTPFGAGAPEPARRAALAAIADLKAKKPIFTGTWKDNAGKVVLNKTYDNYDPYLDQMNYLLEGVVGALT
ncbi:MAG: BMP family ABC transporter substrate-binding protein [Betaproteobacteria bacterium]|nr:BMP family ABC transporter substrate-binding protein [Betaproteobacteria bacterium]